MKKKKQSEKAAVKEINDMEGPGTVNEHEVQNWFRYFNASDTSLKYK